MEEQHLKPKNISSLLPLTSVFTLNTYIYSGALNENVQHVLTGVECYIIRKIYFKDVPLEFVFSLYSSAVCILRHVKLLSVK